MPGNKVAGYLKKKREKREREKIPFALNFMDIFVYSKID